MERIAHFRALARAVEVLGGMAMPGPRQWHENVGRQMPKCESRA